MLLLLCIACRAALLSNLSSKADVVRELESALDNAHHQLDIALQDRALLFEQLRMIAGMTSRDRTILRLRPHNDKGFILAAKPHPATTVVQVPHAPLDVSPCPHPQACRRPQT